MNYTDQNPDQKRSESSLSVSQKKGKTVLLVDDDAKLLRSLERSFADEDYELLTAVSAAEAQIFLAKRSVDLIVSDNLMPGVLGTDFLADVRKEYPRITLLILSGYMPAAVAQRAMDESGVLRVLNKPCKASDVAATIRDALAEAPGVVV